jgi:cell wall-associated NlpC family hydrolase
VELGEVLDDGAHALVQSAAAIFAAFALLLCMALLVPVAVLNAPLRTLSKAGQAIPPVARESSSARPPSVRPHTDVASPRAGSQPADVAQQYIGVPYLFGGTNPAIGLDCSGLVQLVFRQLGIQLPRTAQLQYNATVHLTREQLQPGDLVFFARTYADPHDWITHVGIYVGAGKQINAPTEGQQVSVQPVFSGFWGAHFVAGGRVVGG